MPERVDYKQKPSRRKHHQASTNLQPLLQAYHIATTGACKTPGHAEQTCLPDEDAHTTEPTTLPTRGSYATSDARGIGLAEDNPEGGQGTTRNAHGHANNNSQGIADATPA